MPASNSQIWRCTFHHSLARTKTPPLLSVHRADIKGSVLARAGEDTDAVLFGLARARTPPLISARHADIKGGVLARAGEDTNRARQIPMPGRIPMPCCLGRIPLPCYSGRIPVPCCSGQITMPCCRAVRLALGMVFWWNLQKFVKGEDNSL